MNKLWTWTVSPRNSYAEAIITSVTVFGNRTHKQVVKVKWGHKGRSSSDRPGVLIRWERDQGILSLSLSPPPPMHTQRSHMNTQQGVQAKARDLRMKPTLLEPWNLDLRIQNSRAMRHTFLLLKPPSLQYFIMTSWADKDTPLLFLLICNIQPELKTAPWIPASRQPQLWAIPSWEWARPGTCT